MNAEEASRGGQDSSETLAGSKLLEYRVCRLRGVPHEEMLSAAANFPRTTSPIRQNRMQAICL